MAPPYRKEFSPGDDFWNIYDECGTLIATGETETMADGILAFLDRPMAGELLAAITKVAGWLQERKELLAFVTADPTGLAALGGLAVARKAVADHENLLRVLRGLSYLPKDQQTKYHEIGVHLNNGDLDDEDCAPYVEETLADHDDPEGPNDCIVFVADEQTLCIVPPYQHETMRHTADCIAQAGKTILQMEAEIARLTDWVRDCQSGLYINCVYCGHRYGPADKTEATKADTLKAHIAQCPEHPMSKLRAGLEEISAQLLERTLIADELPKRIQKLLNATTSSASK